MRAAACVPCIVI
jgi:hypothetical protein